MVYNFNRGINEHQGTVLVFGDVDDDELFMYIYLSCREPDARCGIHGFKHVIDRRSQRVGHLQHRCRFFPQSKVGEFENF